MSLLEGIDITAKPTKQITSCSAKDLATLKTKGSRFDVNQLKVKNIAKSWGLNKIQVAAIMGNFMQESTFNPKKFSPKDRNGYTNYGIAQWNQRYTSVATVGDTIESQMAYLPETNDYRKWLSDYKSRKDVKYSTFLFASIVEICFECETRKLFETNKDQCKRTPYAEDFLKRFDDSTDSLYW